MLILNQLFVDVVKQECWFLIWFLFQVVSDFFCCWELFCGCMKVLLVEDNLVNWIFICWLLEKFGCDVMIVNDGEVVVSFWQVNLFDLIFMDCVMLWVDGFEVIW